MHEGNFLDKTAPLRYKATLLKRNADCSWSTSLDDRRDRTESFSSTVLTFFTSTASGTPFTASHAPDLGLHDIEHDNKGLTRGFYMHDNCRKRQCVKRKMQSANTKTNEVKML